MNRLLGLHMNVADPADKVMAQVKLCINVPIVSKMVLEYFL